MSQVYPYRLDCLQYWLLEPPSGGYRLPVTGHGDMVEIGLIPKMNRQRLFSLLRVGQPKPTPDYTTRHTIGGKPWMY